MTCFWDGIIAAIDHDMFMMTFETHIEPLDPKQKIDNIKNFIELLKERAILTKNVKWNNSKLTEQQLEENLLAIRNYNIDNINDGYDCSICDPFLLLVCELFKVDIIHNFIGNDLIYEYDVKQNTNKKIIKFASNHGHFWLCS